MVQMEHQEMQVQVEQVLQVEQAVLQVQMVLRVLPEIVD
jgi:hypothetical protein